MSGPIEFIAAAVLFVLMLAIRLVNIQRYGFDSDESQHLHVIWGWVHGFVQYRDLFDNHMPLFHIMFAPIFGLIGDRATILYEMRLVLLPLYFVAAWCTYQIGTSLFSRRAGIWAVILAGLLTRYHFVSVEFRPDNLWGPLWLLCVTVLVSGPFTVRRALAAGLLFGLCFAVSVKSALFLFSMALAAPIMLLLVGRQRLHQSWNHLAQSVIAFLASTALVPAIVSAFFALKGVWRDFRYCTFDFNFLGRYAIETTLGHEIHLALIVIKALFIGGGALYLIILTSNDSSLVFRRGFLLIFCVSYFLALKLVGPLSRHDNNPPLYPLVAVLCAGGLLALPRMLARFRWMPSRTFVLMPLPAFVAFAEMLVLIGMQPIWKDRTRQETDLLTTVIALLGPRDYVLDCKGEAVFHQRCVRSVFETITRSAIEHGIIVDDTPQRCVETQTCAVATPLVKKLPRDTRRFLKQNYLPVTNELRVAGEELKPSFTDPGRYEFKVTIPASYEIICGDENVSGTLDGIPYNGARFLAAGPHTFESAPKPRSLTLLWAQAVDRHFIPLQHHTSQKG